MALPIDDLVRTLQARVLPPLTPRDIEVPRLPGKADAVVGMRRSGKTFVLYQRMAELRRGGTPPETMLYVNLEDERLAGWTVADLGALEEAFLRVHPEALDAERWFLLDEVQIVAGWERFVRRLLDDRLSRVLVSGSSARMLGREIATSLRGRSLTTEVLPFSFRESLRHHGLPVPGPGDPIAAGNRIRIEHHFLDEFDFAWVRVGGLGE